MIIRVGVSLSLLISPGFFADVGDIEFLWLQRLSVDVRRVLRFSTLSDDADGGDGDLADSGFNLGCYPPGTFPMGVC